MFVSEVSIPAVWKTTEVGFFEYLYVIIFDNADTFVKNFRIYLGNKIFFAEQLSFDIHAGLTSNSSATRTVQFSIKDGLNYKIKIPTDTELI